jgi:hypothetical protein
MITHYTLVLIQSKDSGSTANLTIWAVEQVEEVKWNNT